MRHLTFGNRQLVFVSVPEIPEAIASLDGDFALLLPGKEATWTSMSGVVGRASERLCREYCSVGLGAERAHDEIDALLEDLGQVDVLTTAHEDEPIEDTCWYFVNLAGARPPILVAAVMDDPALVEGLERAAAKADRNMNEPER